MLVFSGWAVRVGSAHSLAGDVAEQREHLWRGSCGCACPCSVGQALPWFPVLWGVWWGLLSLCQGCPAWVCALGRQEVPGERSAHLTDLPALFSQVCNCNKYLKVSRERMRQLVEGSRRASGEHSAGEWVGAQGWA